MDSTPVHPQNARTSRLQVNATTRARLFARAHSGLTETRSSSTGHDVRPRLLLLHADAVPSTGTSVPYCDDGRTKQSFMPRPDAEPSCPQPPLTLFDIAAVWLVLTAGLADVNYRFAGLPITIGVMVSSLALSLILVGLGAADIDYGLRQYEESIGRVTGKAATHAAPTDAAA